MNIKELFILIVLIVLLILVIIQIRKKESFYSDSELEDYVHNKDSCSGDYPFDEDECDEDEYILPISDIHLDFNPDAIQLQAQDRIHIVNPQNPCCLRTCINDFTYTKDNAGGGIYRDKIGQYKEYIDKNLFFASKCNQCLSNFYVALKRLNSTQHCDQTSEGGADSSVSGCNLQI